MRAFVVYTDKITYFGKNAVSYALSAAISRPLAELFHLEKTTRKAQFLRSSVKTDLDSHGADHGIRRRKEGFASVLLVFLSTTTKIISIEESVSAGEDEITVLNGSKFQVGDSIRIRAQFGDPPNGEIREILSKPSANVIRVTTLLNVYATDDFVVLRKVLPSGTTKALSASGIIFKTAQTITVGDTNPLMLGEGANFSLLDKTIAEAETLGESGNIPAFTITALNSAVTGIEQVYNPTPGSGGTDIEDDSVYRPRIQGEGGRSAVETEKWFLAMATEIENTIGRVAVKKSTNVNALEIYVVARSGALYDPAKLQHIKTGYEDRLKSNLAVNVYNLIFSDIFVEAFITLVSGNIMQDGFNAAASNLSAFLNWLTWPFEKTVDDADLLRMVDGADPIDNTSNFKVNGVSISDNADVIISATSLPRLTQLKLTNADDTSQVIGGFITQSFG